MVLCSHIYYGVLLKFEDIVERVSKGLGKKKRQIVWSVFKLAISAVARDDAVHYSQSYTDVTD